MTETMSPALRQATDHALGNQRLLALADLLDRYDGPYNQGGRGGPGPSAPCAAQIWADTYYPGGTLQPLICKHFDLDVITDLNELFGYTGCGNAKSAKQAATYIRGFVARRSPQEQAA